jgi:Domain of unknown function (DUF5615)
MLNCRPHGQRWVASEGHTAVHVFDLGFHTAADPAIWQRAEADDSVIITKDEDFVDPLGAERASGAPGLDSQGELLEPRVVSMVTAALVGHGKEARTG